MKSPLLRRIGVTDSTSEVPDGASRRFPPGMATPREPRKGAKRLLCAPAQETGPLWGGHSPGGPGPGNAPRWRRQGQPALGTEARDRAGTGRVAPFPASRAVRWPLRIVTAEPGNVSAPPHSFGQGSEFEPEPRRQHVGRRGRPREQRILQRQRHVLRRPHRDVQGRAEAVPVEGVHGGAEGVAVPVC